MVVLERAALERERCALNDSPPGSGGGTPRFSAGYPRLVPEALLALEPIDWDVRDVLDELADRSELEREEMEPPTLWDAIELSVKNEPRLRLRWIRSVSIAACERTCNMFERQYEALPPMRPFP